jgi:tetratricopeptide (TPR) repeat protein
VKRVHVDEIEALPALGGQLQWKPVRYTLGIDAFGINAYHGEKKGDLVVEEHNDPHQELYLVVRGRARFRSEHEEFDAPVGTFVLFEPREHRVAHAAEPGTTVVAVGAEAKRFKPSGWEFSFRAKGLIDLGRHGDARRAIQEGLAQYPDRADLFYSRACLESAEGDPQAALESLQEAAKRNEVVLEWARQEPLLQSLLDT